MNNIGEIMGQIKKVDADNFPVSIEQPLFTLYQAWYIKGRLCAWESFRRSRFLQPKGGLYDGDVGGKGVFTNDTIREWITLMDEDMAAYHQRYKTGAKPRNKVRKRLKATEQSAWH